MDTHINFRTATNQRTSAVRSTRTLGSAPAAPVVERPRRKVPRWAAPVGFAVAAVCIAGVGVLLQDANQEPAPNPAPVDVVTDRGPNADLPSDWTIGARPAPPTPASPGPNADLPRDFVVETADATRARNLGPNVDLPGDWTLGAAPVLAVTSRGPNVDMPRDWTRGPTSAAAAIDRGPNADLPRDLTVGVTPVGAATVFGPNVDLPRDWTIGN